MTEEFDLRTALMGRKYPTAVVDVWMDDELFYEWESLDRKLAAHDGQDKKDLARLEARLADVEREKREAAYKVHLRGISPRAGEDIISRAFAEIPIQRDMYGREDDIRTRNRSMLLTEMSFAEHIKKVVNPLGQSQDWTEENKRDLARVILGEAPKVTIKILDAAISQLSKEFADQIAEQSSLDF